MKLFSSTLILFATVFALLTFITPSHAADPPIGVVPAEIETGRGGNPTATFTLPDAPTSTPANPQRRDISDLEERDNGQLEQRQSSTFCFIGWDKKYYAGPYEIVCCFSGCCSFYGDPFLNCNLKSVFNPTGQDIYLYPDPWCGSSPTQLRAYSGMPKLKSLPKYYSFSL